MNDFSNIIDGVFLELGFEIVKLDEKKLYRYKENYYKMTLKKLVFLYKKRVSQLRF